MTTNDQARDESRRARERLGQTAPELAIAFPPVEQIGGASRVPVAAAAPAVSRPLRRATARRRPRGGSIYTRPGSQHLWIKWYDANGVPQRESVKSSSPEEARRLLDERLGDVARGEPVSLKAARLRVDTLLDNLERRYRIDGCALEAITANVRRLRAAFGRRRAAEVTGYQWNAYVDGHRRMPEHPEGLSNATLNRDGAALRRAYSLARKDFPGFKARIEFEALQEAPPRAGFFEAEQFEAVRRHLPEDLRPVVTFAYLTGWRVPSEVLTLTWAQVSFADGAVRLEPGTTKNDEPRTFPFTDELRALLEARRAHTDALQRQTGQIIPWVFHRHGRAIKDFRGAWWTACKAAGCPGRIPHDFRRTAIRTMIRRGVPEKVAMLLSGHKSRAVLVQHRQRPRSPRGRREALGTHERRERAQFRAQSRRGDPTRRGVSR